MFVSPGAFCRRFNANSLWLIAVVGRVDFSIISQVEAGTQLAVFWVTVRERSRSFKRAFPEEFNWGGKTPSWMWVAPSGELGSLTLLPDRTQCDQLPLQPSQLKLLSTLPCLSTWDGLHKLQSQVYPSLNYCLCCNEQKVNAVMVNCLKKRIHRHLSQWPIQICILRLGTNTGRLGSPWQHFYLERLHLQS